MNQPRSLSRRTTLAALAGAALAGTSAVPAAASDRHGRAVRFATFNASLNRGTQGALVSDLSTPDNTQAKNAAETIQRVDPDVLLINEFDYVESGAAVRLFLRNYLAVGQNGAKPVRYRYHFTAPVNTGVASGLDLDGRNGAVTTPGSDAYGQDAYGYGWFPGQYGMAVLSKYPIDTRAVRTFQRFLWRDMPGNIMPTDYYSAEAQAVLRLSSKSHWDVPVCVGRSAEDTVHFLVSHPTPPTFDGTEDRNGRRNHDEIRLWADYIGGAGAARTCTTTRAGAAVCGRGRVSCWPAIRTPIRTTATATTTPSACSSTIRRSTCPRCRRRARARSRRRGSRGCQHLAHR